MWQHIWIAYGATLFTAIFARGLAALPWTSRVPEGARMIAASTAATAGMLAFAAGDAARPAPPIDAYVLAIALWAAFAGAMALWLTAARRPRVATAEVQA
jgi:hypothetical protein